MINKESVILSPRHPDYPAINYLQNLISLAANPAIHLLGYGLGSSPIEQEVGRFNAEADKEDLVNKLKAAQQKLFDNIRAGRITTPLSEETLRAMDLLDEIHP